MAGLKLSGSLQRVEWLGQDSLQKLASAAQAPLPELHFIVLDQKSLDAGKGEFGLSWPWPRETYAQVLEFLHRAGARAIILDFMFTEPSFSGQEDDQELATVFKTCGNVFLPVITKPRGTGANLGDLKQKRPDVWLHPEVATDVRAVPEEDLDLPVPVLLEQAAGLGFVNFRPDADGVLRRIEPLKLLGEAWLGQLGLAPLQSTPYPGRIRLGKSTLQIGSMVLPLDAEGKLVLRYPGHWDQYPRTSLIDIITSNVALREGRVPAIRPEIFKDKIVVVGSTALSLMDLRKTPLDAQVPGFFITAAAWSTLAHGQAWDESLRPLLAWPVLFLVILLGAGWGTRSLLRGLAGLGLTLLLLLAAMAGLFFFRSLSLELVSPVLGLLVAYAASLGFSYQQEQNQKRFIQGAFTQVLSPTVLEGLIQNPGRLATGGELTEITVFFSDLEGFTGLSEKLTPPGLVKVLNTYLHEMIEVIVDDHQGYVDKFIGDAVMAFWGAPLPDPGQARTACLSALASVERLKTLQPRLRELGVNAPLNMRIGIHTGPAIVGMMGSPKKLNYTVIGDTVNLASRLESVNKQFGTRILVSGETIAAAGDAVVSREIDRIRVKGKTLPTRIFELVGRPGEIPETTRQGLEAFQSATQLYWKRKFQAALGQFKRAAQLLPEDMPSQIFIKRCRQFLRTPPPRGWDGVTTMTKK
jgi:adenylate cyclase